jgi:hypothetical protein
MNIKITATVTASDREKKIIEIDVLDIEGLVEQKAKEKGIIPYRSRVFEHYDATIQSVKFET